MADVRIEADGLHIDNGKIFLLDAAGTAVLSPAGFEGSWVNFIAHGAYNSEFDYGALVTGLTAVTGGAALYEDRLSADVPYWVIENLTAGSSYGLVAVGGERAFEWLMPSALFGTGACSVLIYQDVPVAPGAQYQVSTRMSWLLTGTPTTFVSYVVASPQWIDADHVYISDATALGTSGAYGANPAVGPDTDAQDVTTEAPATARYLRVRVAISADVTTAGTMTELKARLRGVIVRRLPLYTPARVEGFIYDNVAQSLAATPMGRFVASQSAVYVARPMPGRTGVAYGIAWRKSASMTAGTITLRGTRAGTAETGANVVLSGSTNSGYTAFPVPYKFTVADSLGIDIESDGSLAPATIDVAADLVVAWQSQP